MIKYIIFFLMIATGTMADDHQPIGSYGTENNNMPTFGFNSNGSSFMILNGGPNVQYYSDTKGNNCTLYRFGNNVYQSCF